MRIASLHSTMLNSAVRNLKARIGMMRLQASGDQLTQQLARAIQTATRGERKAEEASWTERIESLRARLNASTEKLKIEDYGAGNPEKQLTAEQMYQGQVITKTVGELCQGASKASLWSHLLFQLIRQYQPATCIELGTCLGISAAYQAAALKLNKRGRLITLEGAPAVASLAKQNLQSLGLDNVRVVVGRFQDTLGKVLEECGSIDYAFIDGHHDEQATLDYLEQIIPYLSETAILVFDDISWSKGMKRAWRAIELDRRVALSCNLHRIGICVMDKAATRKKSHKLFVA